MFFNANAQTVNTNAPSFNAPSTLGRNLSLNDFKGQWLVLYFYPKAFTPGCTTQSCSLRDGFAEIKNLGVKLLGISLDDISTQVKFKSEYHLPFDLISDSTHSISKDYNTLAFLGLYAKRKTFIIDDKGVIRHVFESVDSKHHAEEVLAKIKELKK